MSGSAKNLRPHSALLKKSKKAPTFREEMNREKRIYANGVKYIEEQKGK